MDLAGLKQDYLQRYGEPLVSVSSPGRINLVGEHTDYNQGFVFPAAIHLGISFVFGKSGSRNACSVYSADFDQQFDFDLGELRPLPPDSWQNYVLGVAAEILKSGRILEGFNLVFSGNIPRGAGLSSSAALECGTCLGLSELFHLNIPRMEMIRMSQMAEHYFAGVKCGIMDQFASMMGQENHAILLDCRDLSFDLVPILLHGYSLVLCNSNVAHSLASSEYNVRRDQCEEAVAVIQRRESGVRSLRDVSMVDLEDHRSVLSDVIFKRAKYVIEENARVRLFAEALEKGEMAAAGNILTRAHAAMRDEYEITCPEIDFLADHAASLDYVAGSRMMGGGFGGCTLNLVQEAFADEFVSVMAKAYLQEFGIEMRPFPIIISRGTSVAGMFA